MKRITFGIGIVLAVLAVLTVQAAADPWEGYLVPQDGDSVCGGDDKLVELWVNYTGYDEGCSGYQVDIYFDTSCINITDADFSESPFSWNGFWPRETYDPPIHIRLMGEQEAVIDPGLYKMATLTIHCECESGGCLSELGFAKNITCDPDGDDVTNSYINGTFKCIGTETFEQDIALGWNLISLPLTPVDNSTSAVLSSISGKYNPDAVFRYNAVTKQFEGGVATMDPGIGYFVYGLATGRWAYDGVAYGYEHTTPMNINLKKGLNLVGWLDCQKDISDGLSSIDGKYNYVARWNASKYELYDTNAPPDDPVFFDFDTMGPGVGYWIAAKEDCTLEEICS